MVRIIFILICIGLGNLVSAQDFSSRIWHEGRVVTSDRDTLKGKVMYNMESNSLLLMISKKRQISFSSKKVLFFEIYDGTVKNFRQFYAIPYKVSQDFKTPIFFEVLYEGALTLLARERIIIENDVSSVSYRGMRSGHEALEYTYYFVDKKGNMQKYDSGKKNDLYPIFIKNREKVIQFIKSNKLHIDRLRDLVRITAFYNSI